MKRTCSIKINPTKEQEEALFALRSEFSKGCNKIAKIAFEESCFNKIKLHHLSYYQVRKERPLGSQMVCNAIRAVAGAYKSLKSNTRGKEVSSIEFKEKSIHFDKRTYSIKEDKLSLYTLKGRTLIPMVLGKRQKEQLLQGSFREAELIFTRGKWLFNLVIEIPNTPSSLNSGVMGVDIGENNMYATSTGKIKGGKTVRNKRDRYLALRRRLQRNGSKSAKQLLRKISGREKRHVKQINHEESKKIIKEAIQKEIGMIQMEDLKHIRKRIKAKKRERTRLHRWSWRQFQLFVEYKADAQGIKVSYFDPAFTSKSCHKCLKIDQLDLTQVKRKKHLLKCDKCGNRAHADVNAALNLAWLGQSADSLRGVVNRPNVCTLV